MDLQKEKWTKKDLRDFEKYLESFKNEARQEWSKNLLKTDLIVLSIATKTIKDMINQIFKGNYFSFLEIMDWKYYETAAISGFLISKITDFNLMKKYLDVYSEKIDNWGNSDLLKFEVKGKEKDFIALSEEYIKSNKTFKRRIGVYILFEFVNNEYIEYIFSVLERLKAEEEYYVNMMCAWLLCECFIKERIKTLKYLKRNKLNKFVVNKGIQKCRESYRVSKEDKELLLQYKVK